MINRRLVRIKALQSIYSFRKNESQDFIFYFKEYEKSIQASYELYLLTLAMFVELQDYAEIRIDQIQNRIIKDEKEWKRLVPIAEHKVIDVLRTNKELTTQLRNNKITWAEHLDIIRKLFATLVSSEFYESYIQKNHTFDSSKELIQFVLYEIVTNSEDFFSLLEDKSIYWNDEVDYILSITDKTIKKLTDSSVHSTIDLPKFKDEDIRFYAKTIFTKTIDSWQQHNDIIVPYLDNWEQERVAEMDIILLHLGVTEAIEFSEIPLKATLNEYIELARWYSTEKSNTFVNGILHTIFKDLTEKNVIVKKGRGLI